MSQATHSLGHYSPHGLKPSQPRDMETRAVALEETCLHFLLLWLDWLPLPHSHQPQGRGLAPSPLSHPWSDRPHLQSNLWQLVLPWVQLHFSPPLASPPVWSLPGCGEVSISLAPDQVTSLLVPVSTYTATPWLWPLSFQLGLSI